MVGGVSKGKSWLVMILTDLCSSFNVELGKSGQKAGIDNHSGKVLWVVLQVSAKEYGIRWYKG